MSGFMEDQVTGKMDWHMIDGNNGTEWYPADDFTLDEARAEYEGAFGKVTEAETVSGYGARLSAPGYMDCTEWCVFDTEQEAEDYLRDTFGDDDDDDDMVG